MGNVVKQREPNRMCLKVVEDHVDFIWMFNDQGSRHLRCIPGNVFPDRIDRDIDVLLSSHAGFSQSTEIRPYRGVCWIIKGNKASRYVARVIRARFT